MHVCGQNCWYPKLKQKQNFLKCFTLHVMNLKYMKVSLFEMLQEKKYIYFRCTRISDIFYSRVSRGTSNCVQHVFEKKIFIS